MQLNKSFLFIFIGIIFLGSLSLFTANQRQTAVIMQFGEAVKTISNPGLHFKLPFIQNVKYFDRRILNVSAQAKELTASDEKRIIVDAFAKYRIKEPVKFIKTVRSYQGAELRLNKLLESSMLCLQKKEPH
jgi:membrane protease subunit HflC